jgi:hypothetical protein
MNQPQAALYTTNFSDPRLLAMTKALAPGALRISGGSSSSAVYGVDPHFAPSNCSSRYNVAEVEKSIAPLHFSRRLPPALAGAMFTSDS